mgnify:CR=1 FL=1|jgi:hypothetical protein
MSEQEKINDYDSEPIAFCAKCFSPKIIHEASIDIDYCGDCGCSSIKEATVEEWDRLYEKKYGHKYVVKSNDPKRSPVFKLPLNKLMDKLFNLKQWKSIILSLYPRFPGGLGKADSIVLFFDTIIKDNKLTDFRLKMMEYIKG